SVRVDFDALPAGRQLVVPAAAVDGDNSFGDLGAVSVGLGSRRKLAIYVLGLVTVERTMVLADLSAAQMFGAVGRQVRGITTDLALLLSRLRCRGGRLTSISFSEK
ncbi:MAG: 3-5 exonuclease, partial [Rhodococcus erythropolis]|nr:3-5 exonuclease [Rhodococcus erythropolis]